MFSVVIPTYNRAHTLAKALDSVLQQSLPADEIIVVDDGSIDNTASLIVQAYPQVRYCHQSNRGVSAARNRGIKMARQPWIALLDSDDRWQADKLAQQARVIESNPDCVLSHCDEIWIRNGTRVNPMNKHKKMGGDIFEHCLPLCCVSPSAAVIRRDVLLQLGLFDESLPACEDYDLWLRLCARYAVHFIEQALIYKYGGHDDQLSRKHWGMDRFRIRALLKLLQSGVLNANQTEATKRMFEHKWRILHSGACKHQNKSLIQDLQEWQRQFEYFSHQRSGPHSRSLEKPRDSQGKPT